MRVGIIGTDNSHVDHCITYLNVEQHRGAETRVVALSGGEPERYEKLRKLGDIEHIVDDPTEMLGHVDAVIVAARHGDLHRDHAVPFLSAGLPVMVDKPLACNVDDAKAIIAAARENNALLTSYSAVVWAPRVQEMRQRLSQGELGEPRMVSTAGPADPNSEYGGIFFYGIHPVDVAFQFVPGELGDVTVEQLADAMVARARVGAAELAVTTVKPGDQRVPFHASIIGTKGIDAGDIPLPKNYIDAGMDQFFGMIDSGQPPISYADLLRPVQFLSEVRKALAAG